MIRTTTAALALLVATAASAQEAPRRYLAIFDLDRAGEVVGMTGCEGEVCFPIDLTGVAVRIDPRTGSVTLVIPADDGSTSSESWDSCYLDFENNQSVCDEFVLPEPCECSEPYEWQGAA